MNDGQRHQGHSQGIVFRRLSEGDLQKIHLASLEILERTGLRLHDEEAISLLKGAGAPVSDGNLVRVPSHLVDWAIRTAPKRIVLFDRSGDRALALQGSESYYGVGSDCLNVLDHRTHERRRAVLSDVSDGMRVCDALLNIDFVMSMFIPSDVPTGISDRHQMEAMLLNTSKPIVFVTHDLAGCRDVVEMAEAVAGGAKALQTNPQICGFLNFSAPLVHNEEALQKLLFLAEKGLPVIYAGSLTTRGGLTPVTMAGHVALVNAGQLAGLVLAQLKRAGTPVICCRTGGGGIDMRTMASLYASPEARGFRGDLAHYYGLPSFGMAGCSDSKVPDHQALMEASLTLLIDTLVGSNLIHDIGYLESGRTGSLELVVMCDEVIGWIKRFTEPSAVNDETLALDLIHELGPGGQYLDTDHTFRHFAEEWYPELVDRGYYEEWAAAGKKTFREKARQRVEELLKSPTGPDLGADLRHQIHAIIERAKERGGHTQ
jgi:trimethylamine--corrinoid protein Co-methyltransferase